MFLTMTAIELLGPVRVLRDGKELPLGPARQRAVLAVLASHAGQVVSRDAIIRAVWGEPEPASAASNLHSYVSGLRRVLKTEVETAASGYLLRVEKDQLDVGRFERLYWRGKAARDPREAEEALTQALALWRGDALQKVPGPWADSERRRLAERRLQVLEELYRVKLRRGAHHELIAELEHLAFSHPQRQAFLELLMMALALADRRAEALGLYREIRDPNPALRRLQALVLAGEEVYVESA
ncbi:DNA-binding transcriptional activator of the SARP family [Kibdelosporangium aridum]|uniref:DNA-binding transcriptional activator of the SARP family n=2 Tax=Kibdelosporangium aridum TaxID=2030 RepID=A0A1Y5Y1V5_KIBAR|nr:DNA-binding transcriptional activator of the SARP family [Kibdelosporangium aridum]